MPRQPEGFEYGAILKRGVPVSSPTVMESSYEQYQEYLYRGHTVMLDRRRKIVAGIFASARTGEQPRVVYLHPSLGGAIRLANWVRFRFCRGSSSTSPRMSTWPCILPGRLPSPQEWIPLIAPWGATT